MPVSSIKVLLVGKALKLPYVIRQTQDLSSVTLEIAQFQPDVIVTFGFIPSVLNLAPFDVRKRWIDVKPDSSPEEIGNAIELCYYTNLWGDHRFQADNPLISVYTGTFNTGIYLRDAYQSLREQSYQNWEWVVVDDHSSDGTWERLTELAREDVRIRPFRSGKRLEKIGAVKDMATRLCKGPYLVELDHDDFLADFALAEIKKAFESDPAAGMVYSNSCNFFEDGTFHQFQDAFWKDRYRWTDYRGKKWLECINPNIYDSFGPRFQQQFAFFLTVGPNHVRAFRASVLRELGGYNANLLVSDDWDLYARMFLRSKCLHIDKMLYFYRFKDGWSNTTFTRNQAIQDHLAYGRAHYASEFSDFNEKRLLQVPAASSPDGEPIERFDLTDLSVIVLEGKPNPLTTECLSSVRKWAPGAEVILVANGEEPSPVAATLADKVVRLETNVRFAAGMNRGAVEATRKVLCILNNDAAFVDETPLRLLRALEDDVMIVGPYSNRAKPPQGDIPREHTPAADAFPSMVTGVCMVLPAVLFRGLGGFDARLYTWEDDDLCARAAELGYRCKVVGGTYVEHERHATFKARGEDVHAVMEENGALFKKKHPRIRVVVIAKDEEGAIREFFGQFASVTKDYGLLDTGSSDRTVEVAREMGVRVESCPFEDFAQARNEALARFREGADWIIMLDPDERLDAHTIRHLKETLFRTPPDVFYAPLKAAYPDGSERAFVPKPFCFRAKPELQWIFKVHEKLVGAASPVIVANARISHVLSLHTGERRSWSEALYAKLAEDEPYFKDAEYRKKIHETWPILDYDHLVDSRIRSVHAGPLISVVMPTYRRAALLGRAVQSAVAQDYENLEVVVVGDDCPELSPACFSGNPRVRVFNLPTNHGAGGAIPRNFGLILAAGSLVAYLDDDNAWAPDHLSSLYAALSASGSEYAFSSMSVDGKDLKFSSPRKGGIDTSCVLHKKALIEKHGWWKDRTEAGYDHDWEFFSRWVKADERWACTQRPTLLYNADTSGQAEFVRALADQAALQESKP